MSKNKVIIIEESVTRSLIKDIFTFGMFAGLLYFNHQYLSGSTFIDFLFIVLVIMLLVGRSSKDIYKGDAKGAKEFLSAKSNLKGE